MNTPNEDVSRFIMSSFSSIWSLELLLLLKRQPGYHGRDDLIARLRGSELVVSQAVEALVSAGLAAKDDAGRAAYAPASDEAGAIVDQVEELYGRRPDAIRRLIINGVAPGLAAFADAFRIRKD